MSNYAFCMTVVTRTSKVKLKLNFRLNFSIKIFKKSKLKFFKLKDIINEKMSLKLINYFFDDKIIKKSMIEFISILLLAIVFIFCSKIIFNFWKFRIKFIKFAETLPGPRGLPLIGNALEFAIDIDESLNKIAALTRQFGPRYRFWMGPKLLVVTSDPNDFEIVLASPKASSKDSIYDFVEPMLGKGLITGSGSTQRNHRKIMMPMVNGKVLNEYSRSFKNCSNYCAELLKNKIDCGEFDIRPFMTNCTTDMIFETVFGVPGTAQKGGYKQFIHYSEQMYEFFHTRMMKVWLHPDFIFHRTSLGKEQKIGLHVLHSVIDNIIARKKVEHLAHERGTIGSGELRFAVLEQLLDYSMEHGSMSDIELRCEIHTIYLAAQDTVAVISSFVLLMLAMHREYQNKVRDELINSIDNGIIEDNLSNFKYLDMVIKETLRLFPIGPLMARRTTGEIKLDTCTIPEGCSIVMVPFATHRDERYWENPEKFYPERFLPGNSESRHPLAYVPFSHGIRGCLGQRFAMTALKILLSTLIRNYEFLTDQSYNELELTMDISVRSKNGYKMRIKKVGKSPKGVGLEENVRRPFL